MQVFRYMSGHFRWVAVRPIVGAIAASCYHTGTLSLSIPKSGYSFWKEEAQTQWRAHSEHYG